MIPSEEGDELNKQEDEPGISEPPSIILPPEPSHPSRLPQQLVHDGQRPSEDTVEEEGSVEDVHRTPDDAVQEAHRQKTSCTAGLHFDEQQPRPGAMTAHSTDSSQPEDSQRKPSEDEQEAHSTPGARAQDQQEELNLQPDEQPAAAHSTSGARAQDQQE